MPKRCLTLMVAAMLAASLVHAAPAPKKTSKPAGPSLSSQVTAQRKQIEALQDSISQQQARFVAQQALADSQAVRLDVQQAQIAQLLEQLAQTKQRLESVAVHEEFSF